MAKAVRLARGMWVKDGDGNWGHEVDLVGLYYSVEVKENDEYATVEKKIKEELCLGSNDSIEITYQWPHWVIGPGWRKYEPVDIKNDEDVSLFMAIRADLEEVYLRVRVISMGSEPSAVGNDVLDVRSVLTPIKSWEISDMSHSLTEGKLNVLGSRSLRGGPTSNGRGYVNEFGEHSTGGGHNVLGTGSLPRTCTGLLHGATCNGKGYAIEVGESLIRGCQNELSAYNSNVLPIEVGGSSAKGTGILTRTSTALFDGVLTIAIGESSGRGTGILLQTSPAQVEGTTARNARGYAVDVGESSRRAGGRNEIIPQLELNQRWLDFLSGSHMLDRPPIDTTRGETSADHRRPKYANREMVNIDLNVIGNDIMNDCAIQVPAAPNKVNNETLLLTLAGSNGVGNMVIDFSPTESSNSSSDSWYSSVNSVSTNASFAHEELMEDSERDAHLRVSLIGGDMIPRRDSENEGLDLDRNIVSRHMIGPSEKGKGIVTNGEVCIVDKGKGIVTDGEVQEKGASSRAPIRLQGQHVAVWEPRIHTTLYDRDAPPYFDEPIPEDELQRALHDVNYEGDEIFVGRMFKNKDECKMKLAIHAINRKFHFIHARSCPNMVIVVCVSDQCPWRVYAAKMEDSERFEIRSTTLHHICSIDTRSQFHRQASTTVIGSLMRSRYGGEVRGPRPNELRRMLRQEYSLHVSYWKAWRAREIAMDNAMGSAMGSFALIPPYFKKMLETNPNSIVGLETEFDRLGLERFKYLFYSFDACAKGYQYMRKVVVIDGTHLRGRYGGCLVAASAQDGNFQIYPIAFGIVNSENDDAWEWFMRKLSAIVPDDPDLVFVSDRHSSIYASIRKVYPMASHAACIVHLQRNVQSIFKSATLHYLVGQAARAYRLTEFNKIFDEIRAIDSACADYLTNIGFEHWTRSHFVGERFNIMTSNISESLNNVLTTVRDYPVISILETIRTTLVTWFAFRREAAATSVEVLTPKVKLMIMKNFKICAKFFVLKIGDGLYEVRDELEIPFSVNLWEKTCTCREFQLLCIPCSHAVAAAIREGIPIDSLAGVHYTVELRRLGYAHQIMPVPDMDSLTPSPADIAGGNLAPPSVRRPPGRPRKKRFFSRGEFKKRSNRRCTRCRIRGHNRATCKMPKDV